VTFLIDAAAALLMKQVTRSITKLYVALFRTHISNFKKNYKRCKIIIPSGGLL